MEPVGVSFEQDEIDGYLDKQCTKTRDISFIEVLLQLTPALHRFKVKSTRLSASPRA
jgi:hypothetical protein